MATSYYQPAPTYSLTSPTAVNNIGYNNSKDPRVATANQRQLIAGQGDALQANDESLANQYQQQQVGTQNYLNPVESTLAGGGGGYAPSETSQIELNPATADKINYSPQDIQNLVTGAGISAGAGTASAVGAAERAAAAGGGNPAALATYRARAAQTEGANAGDAMTKARTEGKQLEASGATTAQGLQSAGAQAVGNAAIGQQNQALGYYGNLQAQQGQQGLSEQGLQQGAYGTEAGTGTQATGQVLQASQTPSTSDKIIGGVTGALSALEDGTAGYLNDGGMDAVVGENGPEAIVEAASDPVRSNTTFMEDGFSGGTNDEGYGMDVGAGGPTAQPSWASRAGSALQNYLRSNSQQKPAGAAPGSPAWNPTTPYSQIGSAVGGIVSHLADGMKSGFHWSDRQPHMLHTPSPKVPYLADGGSPEPPQIITKPTRVHLNPDDQVIPLSYRPKAKIRPSAAVAAMPMMPKARRAYGPA